MEEIYSLNWLVGKYGKRKKDLHMVVIDIEKAYYKVHRDVISWVLKIKVIKYKLTWLRHVWKSVTNILYPGGKTSEFSITIELHQGSPLSPYLLVDETARSTAQLETLIEALESIGFRIKDSKVHGM